MSLLKLLLTQSSMSSNDYRIYKKAKIDFQNNCQRWGNKDPLDACYFVYIYTDKSHFELFEKIYAIFYDYYKPSNFPSFLSK
jgi:hypothetical protein